MDLLDEDRVWREVPAESIANAGIMVLYEVKSGDEQQHQRLIRRLEEAIRREPTKDSLRFSLANVQMLQGRYDEAEASFRAIHERDKTRATPLNNLAWMNALRGEGRADEALKLINQAIELEGELPNFLDTRALAQIAAGRRGTRRSATCWTPSRPIPRRGRISTWRGPTSWRTNEPRPSRHSRKAKSLGLEVGSTPPAGARKFPRAE